MRIGIRGRKLPPNRAAGFVLIIVGGVIVLTAMPLFVYAAVIGFLIIYVGYTLIGR